MEQSEYINGVVNQCSGGGSLVGFVCFMGIWILFGVFFDMWNQRRKLKPYNQRSCTGRDWRRQFPLAPKDDIRAFLHLFCDEFLLAEDRFMLKLKPDDTIKKVAKSFDAQYEYNFLQYALETDYGIDLENEPELHREGVTLGELFAVTQKYSRLASMTA